MKMKMKRISPLVLVFLFGCATPFQGPPKAGEMLNADFGDPPTNYEQPIRGWFKGVLFDPFSAQIEIGKPEKAWWGFQGGLAVSRRFDYGWRVISRVNAKNRMGGYTGWKIYFFFFRYGQMQNVSRFVAHGPVQ